MTGVQTCALPIYYNEEDVCIKFMLALAGGHRESNARHKSRGRHRERKVLAMQLSNMEEEIRMVEICYLFN